MDLRIALKKNVIVTEEGRPSCANPDQNAATINDEIDYFQTWSKHANQSFDSYYWTKPLRGRGRRDKKTKERLVGGIVPLVG
jgi:hypothetical protein